MKVKNEIGNRYGRLTVVKFVGLNKQHRAVWLAKCDCGKETTVVGRYLRNGDTTSCGCRLLETQKEFVLTQSGTKWKQFSTQDNGSTKKRKYHNKNNCYTLWRSMKKRCEHPIKSNLCYQGITVCDEWKNNFRVFEKWCYENGYKDMRDKPFKDRLSIDRIDTSKGYSPDNCRFITVSENSRRANIARYHDNTEVS